MKYKNFDEFQKAYLGKAVDYDHTAGVQCVDLVDQFLKDQFDITGVWVNGARDLYNKFNTYPALVKNFDKIANTRSLVIKKGDIIVWGGGTWGHTGLGTGNGNIDWFESIEQNTLGKHEPTQLVKHYFNGSGGNDGCNPVLGVLRAKDQTKINGEIKAQAIVTPVKTETKTNTTSTKKVIDISYAQPKVDYAKLAKDVDGAIIRIGYRGYGSAGTLVKDDKFDTHIKGLVANKIPYGFYFFSQAKNAAEGKAEADYAYSIIKSYKPTYPVYIDSEGSGAPNNSGRADKISKADRTAACVAFCKRIKELGLMPGVYASASWFKSNLDYNQLKSYSIWVAYYTTTDKPESYGVTTYDGWQYTSSAAVDGISTKVDMSKFTKSSWATPKKETEKVTYKTYYANDPTGVNYRVSPNGTVKGTHAYGKSMNIVVGSEKTVNGIVWVKTKGGYWVAKKLLTTTQPNTNKFIKGKSYTLTVDIKVRSGASTTSTWIARSKLTAADKKLSYNQAKAVLKKGSKITAKDVKKISDKEYWAKIGSGWIAAMMNGTSYMK